jgi:ABC-type uncharacterized transport system permease subunit
MNGTLLLSLSALAALVPAALAPSSRIYWWMLGVAVAGPALWLAFALGGEWRTGLATALWLSVLASLVLFIVVAAVNPVAQRLTTLLLAYLIILGALATIWQHAPERPLAGNPPPAWLQVHILVAVAAYGLLTLAAVAGVGVVIQERALKRKKPTRFSHGLPSVAEGEGLQVRLLTASWIVLAAALATGVAIDWVEHRILLKFDHKTVLSLLAFAAIGALLVIHHRTGLRGRRAARYVLAAYLLLTLAYPGVKFVTDVLIG